MTECKKTNSVLSIGNKNDLQGRDELLFESLKKFYEKNDGSLEKIAPIIDGKSKISLRIIDCFVTSFSKNNQITCDTHNKHSTPIHKSYKCNLNAYHGKYFSIFKRTQRINVLCGENKILNTTIAQLNFFRWIIENKILEKVEQYYDDICKELYENSGKDKKNGAKQYTSNNTNNTNNTTNNTNDTNDTNDANYGELEYSIRSKKDKNAGCIDIKISLR